MGLAYEANSQLLVPEALGWSLRQEARQGTACAALEAAGFPLTRRCCRRGQYTRPNRPSSMAGRGPAGPDTMLRPSTAASTFPAGATRLAVLLDIAHRPGTCAVMGDADIYADDSPKGFKAAALVWPS